MLEPLKDLMPYNVVSLYGAKAETSLSINYGEILRSNK